MKWHRSMISTFYLAILTAVVMTAAMIGGFWIIQSNAFYKSEVDHLKEDYLNLQKNMVEHEVNTVIEDIDYRTKNATDRLKKNIQERLYEAYQIGIGLYEEHHGTMTDQELETLIVEVLRDMRYNHGRGYFFADTLKGDVVLYPIKPETEGGNIYELEDQLGNKVIQHEIRMIIEKNEGFVEGYWTKPNEAPDQSFLKISFVKYFEPFDWYIGTGEYLDDVVGDIREEVFQRYTEYRFGEDLDHYVFMASLKGEELVNGMYPEYVGQNLWELKDKSGRAVVQEEIQLALDHPDGAYIQHFWKDPQSNHESEKLTFVKAYPAWGIIVGSGVDMEEVEKNLLLLKDEVDQETWRRMLNIVGLVSVVAVVGMIFVKYLEAATVKNFKTYYDFFEMAVYKKEPIQKEELNFSEFRAMADAANGMLEEQMVVEKKLQQLNENLEEMVQERTTELEASMKKLVETQNLLIQNEKLSLIGGLVSGLTHELDNPLGITLSLVSNVERLTEEFKDKKEQGELTKSDLEEYLADTSEELKLSLKNLRKTIDLVDRFQQISIDQSSGEKQLFDLKTFIEEHVRSVQQKFNRPQIHIHLICDEGVEVFSNPADFTQILNNLFVNAYIHAFDFDSPGEITVEVMHNESRLLLLFKDNGKGIPTDDLQRIFEPFFTTRKDEGQSGLGLNIVYDLVTNKLDGNLNVSSREGFGTEFDIEIPIKEDLA